jgi:hypothetical protein
MLVSFGVLELDVIAVKRLVPIRNARSSITYSEATVDKGVLSSPAAP